VTATRAGGPNRTTTTEADTINFTRRIAKNNEVDRLVNVPKNEQGWVSRFAELHGIDGVHRDRAIELMPYGVTRSDITSRVVQGDPGRACPRLRAHEQG